MNVDALSTPEKVLWRHGVRAPEHIDLEAIANHRGARVIYRPLDGCAARLVASGDKAVISVDSGSPPGRRAFSLAHELAHWICDKERGGFRCASEDIGPQNAEAKSVEAQANQFASQLVLPDFLVGPRIEGKRVNLDTAKVLSADFGSSLTAAAIKLVKKSATPAAVACHGQSGLKWFQKNLSMPFDFYVMKELHHETAAIKLAFGAGSGMSRPCKEPANRWLSGPDTYRATVESQSVKLPDGTVLTVIALCK